MEQEPDTTNVLYMDEYRKARWMAELKRSRNLGQLALFNGEYENPAQLILFPDSSGDVPDPAA